MSLIRYENEEIIVQQTEPQYGQLFTDVDLSILPHAYLIPNDPNFVKSNISQLHIYSFYGDYIAGDHNASYLLHDAGTNSLLVDLADTFREAGIARGSYIIAVNLFKQIWGSPDSTVVYVREISPNRDEVKLSIPSHLVGSSEFEAFQRAVEELKMQNIFNNMIIDFGFNRISKVTLIRFDKEDPSVIYLKLYKPIEETVIEKDQGWFGFETMNPYVDTIILTTPVAPGQVNKLRGANYDIDVTEWTSNATIFKSWNDLLDADAPTSQRIIDASLSGSAQARLNIDYSNFENYIFYSSAEERVKNFYYKVGLIEGYNDTISALQNSTASITTYISSSVDTNQRRIDTITSNFDSFERWMYYDDTGSLFTHDITGSVTPYPKYLSDGRYTLHHTTSSIATTWYNGLVASASAYDADNVNRLWWSIPEHVLMDEGNNDYILFVDMIGQHFDNLYAYVRALTKIHERDEHPERGISNDLLYHVAKSFGWNLQNTRQLSDLWFYKAGLNSTGQLENTGSLFQMSTETQTQQIWRRIVNNLPYLLKTKGTTRSVKALMSIYGIPQTLISIKEYGGPSEPNDKPQLIEDRFGYAVVFEGSQSVEMNRVQQTSFADNTPVPDTIMFRFNSEYSASAPMTLLDIEQGGNINSEIRLHHASELTGTSSYSGSYTYGRLEFLYNDGSTTTSSSIGYLPLFDGDMWTVRLYTDTSISSGSSTGSFNLEVARADDCTYGRYILSGSTSLTVLGSGSFDNWIASNSGTTVRLGGSTSTGGVAADAGTGSFLSGSMHAYKEYFKVLDKEIFDEHVLNPGAYHVSNPTSSYDYLYRYFPMGLDVIRYDHTVTSSVSSSHPNQDKQDNTYATFNDFTGTQSTQYRHFRETHYIYTPSIGGNNIRNSKIRLENSYLTRDLSPTGRAERSSFDLRPIDTNRLAIVFSLADQVNRDIFNQFGFDELDDWIADPDLQCEWEYAELKRFSAEYYKKYEQRNDINAFIRILSVYDYSFFEQIRQLVPGRADLIAGILIEPNILERSKICIAKRPTVENPQWDQTIKIVERPPQGEYPVYETSMSAELDVDFEYCYLTASLDYEQEITYDYCYLTASIEDPFEISGSSIHHQDIIHQRTGICGVVDVYPNRYSGSQCVTQSIIDQPRKHHDCKYYCVEFHYSASGVFDTRYIRQWYTAVSKSYGMYYSRSLKPCGYQIDECGTRNNSRFRGSKMSSPDFNVDSPDTVDGGPVVTIIESNPNSIFIKGDGEDGNLFVE